MKTVAMKGGSRLWHEGYIGPAREITADTDLMSPVFQDGMTPGGFPARQFTGIDIFSGDLVAAASRSYIAAYTLLIDRDVEIATNLSLPESLHLSFQRGGKLLVASGKTLTLNCPITAGPWQIFSGAGSFAGKPKVECGLPEWFGAKGDGTHDDTPAVQKTCDLFDTICFTRKFYVGEIVVAQGFTRKTLFGTNVHETGLVARSAVDTVLSVPNPNHLVLRNFTVDCAMLAQTAIDTTWDYGSGAPSLQCFYENILVQGHLGTGWKAHSNNDTTFHHVVIRNGAEGLDGDQCGLSLLAPGGMAMVNECSIQGYTEVAGQDVNFRSCWMFGIKIVGFDQNVIRFDSGQLFSNQGLGACLMIDKAGWGGTHAHSVSFSNACLFMQQASHVCFKNGIYQSGLFLEGTTIKAAYAWDSGTRFSVFGGDFSGSYGDPQNGSSRSTLGLVSFRGGSLIGGVLNSSLVAPYMIVEHSSLTYDTGVNFANRVAADLLTAAQHYPEQGSFSWVKVGVIRATGVNQRFAMTLLGGVGVNAGTGDINHGKTEIVGAFQDNTVGTSANIVASLYGLGGRRAAADVKFKQIGSDRLAYEVHAQVFAYSPFDVFVQGGPGITWEPAIPVASTDPGADSSTVRAAVANVYVTSDMSPAFDNAYNLGTSLLRWKQIYAANGTVSTSDAREKTEIAPETFGLEFVESLKPVSFRYLEKAISGETTTGDRVFHGFLAQDVAELADPGVHSLVDASADRLGLRYTEIVGPLVKAVQELSARVKELEAASATP